MKCRQLILMNSIKPEVISLQLTDLWAIQKISDVFLLLQRVQLIDFKLTSLQKKLDSSLELPNREAISRVSFAGLDRGLASTRDSWTAVRHFIRRVKQLVDDLCVLETVCKGSKSFILTILIHNKKITKLIITKRLFRLHKGSHMWPVQNKQIYKRVQRFLRRRYTWIGVKFEVFLKG